MSLPIRPLLSALRHHRLTVGLLMVQVALTCAIVANAAFMIGNRLHRIHTPTGIPEDEISLIEVDGVQADSNPQAQQQTDLAALRAIPGITSAVAIGGWAWPLAGGSNDHGGCPDQASLERAIAAHSADNIAGCVEPTYYSGSPGFVQALGAHLVAGRDFNADEYGTGSAHSIIVTRALAQTMWPGKNPVGQAIYGGDQRTVVGVIDDLLRPTLRSDAQDRLVVLAPEIPNDTSSVYLLRSAPSDRRRILQDATKALEKAGPVRLIPEEFKYTFTQVRQKYFQRDTTMVGLLIASSLALLFVTALGIGGLANFWVGQRTRQIGIRRAIGATRDDILHHFQAENFLIVGAGVVLGMVLAYGLNQLLMRQYELDRLPLFYLPIGAALLWTLGQVAVLGPALRASRVPPAIATRAG